MSYEKEIKLLDHGYIKYICHMGSDTAIVEAARMSTGGTTKGDEADRKLLDFLFRHDHSSPFEMGEIVFEVQMPIFVFRQWDRHRSQELIETEILAVSTTDNSSRMFVSKNEFSGRYSEMPILSYIPAEEHLGKQGKINKQGTEGDLTPEIKTEILKLLKSEQEDVHGHYESYLEYGLARETARINLGLSQYTKLRIKANVLNWCKFLDKRLRKNAQYEIRVYAEAIAKILQDLFPWTWAAFEEHTYNAVKFSASEMKLLRDLLNGIDEEKIAPALNHLNWPKSRVEEFLQKLALNSEDL